MKATTPAKRPRGRPPIDPSGPQRPVSVKLSPGEREYLARKYGSISGGIRAAIQADMRRR